MKTLMAVMLLLASSQLFGGMTYSQDASGGVLEWTPFEGTYENLVVRCDEMEYDAGDPDWGTVLATVFPDSSGEFPTSVEIPGAFVVDKDKCIACGLCIGECPVGAITTDEDGTASIDPETCIACGICTAVCPTAAIFAPNSGRFYGLFGVTEDGIEEFLQGTAQ